MTSRINLLDYYFSVSFLNINFTTLLEFLFIKELYINVFSSISFDITSFDLCNACSIIFK